MEEEATRAAEEGMVNRLVEPMGAKATPKEAKLEVEKLEVEKLEVEKPEVEKWEAEEGMVNRLVEPMGAKATPKEAKLEVEKLEVAKREVAKLEVEKLEVEKWEAAAMEQVEEGAGLVMEKEIEGVAAREVMLVEVNRYPG
jgi:hypothetical protein